MDADAMEQMANSAEFAPDLELYRVPTLDYFSFFKLSGETAYKYWIRYRTSYRHNYSIPFSFIDDVMQNCCVAKIDLILTFALAMIWTVLRIHFTRRVIVPMCYRLQLPADERAKVPESVWKLMFYSVTWSMSVYVVLAQRKYCYFHDPLCVWDVWVPYHDVPFDIYVMYLVQISFYIHSLYGTLFLDIWRKDSVVMILHHILTITLIGFSYAARHHAVGALVLLLHDISDVILEFTKLNVYLKRRGGKHAKLHDMLASVGFLAFATSWFVFRLYLFPLKVIYTTLYGAYNMTPPQVPFIPVFNIMLCMLLAMNAYWFHFILALLYKVATGQMRELDDTRDFEVDFKAMARGDGNQNGAAQRPLQDNVANGFIRSDDPNKEASSSSSASSDLKEAGDGPPNGVVRRHVNLDGSSTENGHASHNLQE